MDIGSNTIDNYLLAVVVFVGVLLILKFFKNYVIRWIHQVAKQTKTDLDDVVVGILDSIRWPVYVVIGGYVGAQFLELSETVDQMLMVIMMVVVGFYVVRIVQELVDYGIDLLMANDKGHKKDDEVMVSSTIKLFARLAVWVFAVMMVLQNVGVDVLPLLGGLGIGGIAIAFAFQNILEDIFSYFTIYFDKPFKIGDVIVIGADMGTVEKIGLKTSRIRLLQGEEMVISNKELTGSRVRNFKRLKKRRAVFKFGVEYETPVKKVKLIPDMVKEIVAGLDMVELNRVYFTELGDFSLNFEVVYYVNSQDIIAFREAQQALNLQLMERFEKERIGFAYPTQKVFMEKMNG